MSKPTMRESSVCGSASECGRVEVSLAGGDARAAQASGCPVAHFEISADSKGESEWTAGLKAHVRLGCVLYDGVFAIKGCLRCR
jgi:hypothetical protein